jgi:hypothetical protein
VKKQRPKIKKTRPRRQAPVTIPTGPGQSRTAAEDATVDELGILRGQNAEKGNTLSRRHIRDEGVVGH